MTLPGFTADASLKRGATKYAGDDYDRRFADAQGGEDHSGAPQLPRLRQGSGPLRTERLAPDGAM